MLDMDNQVQELEYILPDDYEEETEETTEEETEELEVGEEAKTEETTEESETEEVTEETQEVEETVEETVEDKLEDLEIKYLHETKALKDIPKDELKTLVQKGMNYDRINEKATLANEKLDRIKELSNLYGMDDQKLIDTLFENYFEATAENEGLTKEQVRNRFEQGKKDATQKMYDRFMQKHPNLKAEEIPETVWEAVKYGEDLTKAYEDHLNNQTIQAKNGEVQQLKNEIESLKKQLQVKEQNDSVKKKSPVKSTSKNGNEDVGLDDFEQGLLGL